MIEKRIQLKINAMAPNKIVKARINIKKKEKLIKKTREVMENFEDNCCKN